MAGSRAGTIRLLRIKFEQWWHSFEVMTSGEVVEQKKDLSAAK